MPTSHVCLKIPTGEAPDIQDITERVEEAVKESGVQNGIAIVFVRHTTAAIIIGDREPGLLEDFKVLLEGVIPQGGDYLHNNIAQRDPETLCGDEEHPNAHSHLQQITFGRTSETIPLKDGELQLGRWQRILFLELSDPREREVLVTVIGDLISLISTDQKE